jgi:hypothetical protein
VVLVDWDLVESIGKAPWSREKLLSGLLWHPFVECYRYADEGPPSQAEARAAPDGKEYFPGWAVLSSPSAPTPRFPGGTRSVRYIQNDHLVSAGVFTGNLEEVRKDQSTVAYRELGEVPAAARQEADALAALAGEALGADIFVTDRPYLHEPTWRIAGSLAVCSPRVALALLGLYLRAQREFVVSQERNVKEVVSRGQYYLGAARELLPSSSRWLAACRQFSGDEREDTLMLCWTLLDRVARALQCRDEVYLAAYGRQGRDAADEALGAFDGFALWLMGALDVSARVVHGVLGLPGPVRNAGWQKAGWTKNLGKNVPDLASLVDQGSSGETAMTILRILRNSVHGEALGAVETIGNDSARSGALIRLPKEESATLQRAIADLGGAAKWGIQFSSQGRTYVDPVPLLDHLLLHAVGLLDGILEKTATALVSSAHAQEPDVSEYVSEQGPYGKTMRQSALWQLGY